MRSSFDIPDPLFRRAKKVAAARGTSLRALVIEGLRGVVEGGGRESYQLEDCSFGGSGLVPGLDWGDHETMQDLVYGDDVP